MKEEGSSTEEVMGGEVGGVFERMKPPLAMLLAQAFTTGMILLNKIMINRGAFIFALLMYRGLFGALFILPFALFIERGEWRKLKWEAIMWIFFNAVMGYSLPIGLIYYGLRDTTPAYAINFLAIIPILTFILAVIFRAERLGIGSIAGSMKVVGTLVCVGGAIVISLYSGKALHIWPSYIERNHPVGNGGGGVIAHHQLRGSLFYISGCFCFSCWYLVQAKMIKVYPFRYWATMMTCIFGTIQTTLVGIILNREKVAWTLRWDLELLTVAYSGALNTGAKFWLVSWVVSQCGPTYPSMFGSLAIIFTTILDSLLLGDPITVGSLLGMIMIIGGLYIFLWGRGKQEHGKDKS